VRPAIAENLMRKQQLIVLRRGRRWAPSPKVSDRLRIRTLFLSPARIEKVVIALRPSTLVAFHQAFVRRKYRRLFSSTPCPNKPGPKGPDNRLIKATSNSGRGHTLERAELNHVRWVSHCRDLVHLPAAA
jgi:hypothetical protein